MSDLGVFLSDRARGREWDVASRVMLDVARAVAEFDALSTWPGSFVGFVRPADGAVLQFRRENDGSLSVDVPQPARAGSLVGRATPDAGRALIAALAGGTAVDALSGLTFEHW